MSINRTVIFAFLLIIFFIFGQRFGWFIPEVVADHKCEFKKEFLSGANKVSVIELYTSEGCSSCPPAEKWINSLYNNKNLYKSFIPLAFHVNYWDYIGHKDPYAHNKFTNRQRRYASEWGSKTVYTPGFALNGKEWRSLNRKAPGPGSNGAGELVVARIKENEFKINFSKKGNYLLNGAILINGMENKISRGENAGKKLDHYFVVSNMISRPYKKNMIVGLKEKHQKFKSRSVAFWISDKKSLVPLQAAGGCLAKFPKKEKKESPAK